MKKGLKRFVSYLSIVAMLVGSMSNLAFADVVVDEEVIIEETAVASQLAMRADAKTYTGSFYELLDEDSKIAYNVIMNAYKNGPKPTYYQEGKLNKFKIDTISTVDGNNANDIIDPAIWALRYDHPEMGWLVNCAYYMVFNSTGFYVCVPNEYKGETYENTGNEQIMNDAISKAVSEIAEKLPEDATNYDIVKGIHDYICQNVKYETEESMLNIRQYQTSYSIFFDVEDDADKTIETVCAGYATGFKVLADRFGINSVVVCGTGNGGSHAWNSVQMEDGKWYALDITWDDNANGGYDYDYFLIGSTKLNRDHVENAKFSDLCTLVYPTLSQSDYVKHTHNYNQQVVSDKYLVSEATIDAPATYNYSCTCGKASTSTFTVGTKLEYNEAEYSWDADYNCTALAVCKTDSTKNITETVAATSEITKAATCKAEGTLTYTATFTNSLFATQTVDVAIEKANHTVVDDEAVEATIFDNGLTAGTHCSVCGEVIVAQEATDKLEGEEQTVYGKISTKGSSDAAVTIQLLDENGAVVKEMTIDSSEDTYMFEEISDGNYSVRISKAGNAPRTYSLEMLQSGVEVSLETTIYGDANMDGKINKKDSNQIVRYLAGKSSVISGEEDDYISQLADINGDGKINKKDSNQIVRYLAGKSSCLSGLLN